MQPNDLVIPAEALKALPLLQQRLGRTLSAVYLHGSAVAAGLREKSDVDLLVFVDETLPLQKRKDLSSDLLAVSGHYPVDALGRRPLEVIVLQLADLNSLTHHARAEFVYGEWLRAALESGAIPERETSPEITLLLAQARNDAVALIGPDIGNFVPAIPLPVIRQALAELLPIIVGSVDGDERNALLTLARMWRTATTGEFVSKDEAADWAKPLVSGTVAETLKIARNAYLGSSPDTLHLVPTDVSGAVNEMRERIISALQASS